MKGLVDVLKIAQKEKVVRVNLMCLRNMLADAELGLASDMVEAGLPKVVTVRSMQVRRGDEAEPLPLKQLHVHLGL